MERRIFREEDGFSGEFQQFLFVVGAAEIEDEAAEGASEEGVRRSCSRPPADPATRSGSIPSNR